MKDTVNWIMAIPLLFMLYVVCSIVFAAVFTDPSKRKDFNG